MALPAMLSMLINALYNIVDSIFVAQYSQSALAAVSLVFRCKRWSLQSAWVRAWASTR